MIAVTAVIAVAIGLFFLFGIPKLVKRQLDDLRMKFLDLADRGGDLTFQLEIHGDTEISHVSSAFNLFLERIRSTLADITQQTRFLVENNQEVSALIVKTGTDLYRAKLNGE